MVLMMAPVLFSQTISKIEFHYYSGITSQDSYGYDMTVKNDGAVDLVFQLKGFNENGIKSTSYGYNYMITPADWNYLTDFISSSGNLIFPGMDSTVGDAGYGSQLYRSKIYFTDGNGSSEYYKIPDASVFGSKSKMDDVMSPFYSKLKSLIPENIAVDFFAKKKQFYSNQRGQ